MSEQLLPHHICCQLSFFPKLIDSAEINVSDEWLCAQLKWHWEKRKMLSHWQNEMLPLRIKPSHFSTSQCVHRGFWKCPFLWLFFFSLIVSGPCKNCSTWKEEHFKARHFSIQCTTDKKKACPDWHNRVRLRKDLFSPFSPQWLRLGNLCINESI